MTRCAGSQADGVWAMPSARALLVASLLTEPPFGCLGPSGNDRYRKRSEAVGASRVGCQVAAILSGTGDRGTTTAGRRDKRGSPVEPQAKPDVSPMVPRPVGVFVPRSDSGASQ